MSFLFSLVFIFGFLFFELDTLMVSRYLIKSDKVKQPFSIVHLSDLHSKRFGKQNQRLIKKVRQLNPDVIVTTGDMITSTDDNGEAFLAIAKALAPQISMYYIEGNHELTAQYDELNLKTGWYEKYLKQLETLGVHVLQNESNEMIIKDVEIQIQGLTVPLSHYCAIPNHISKESNIAPISSVLEVLEKPMNHKFNILLAHNPFLASMYDEHGVDLICCGHVHGGAIRLPFLGGVLSPERKFFPKYSGGVYHLNQSHLIVSRGLGRFRLFNRPEIVNIKINAKS